MRATLRMLLLGPLGLLAAVGPAQAAVTFYTDSAAWLAAAGGSTTFFEDFSDFTTDEEFRTVPVALDGMTIQQDGVDDEHFFNYVDSAQFGHDAFGGEFNGTNYAALLTNLPGDTPEIEVQISFDQPNRAFGFQYWMGSVQEGAQLEIFDGFTLIGSPQSLGSANDAFLGYVLSGGDSATSVKFSSITALGDAFTPAGEGFNIDDLQGVAVPEPGTGALLALGLAALTARARRRR